MQHKCKLCAASWLNNKQKHRHQNEPGDDPVITLFFWAKPLSSFPSYQRIRRGETLVTLL